ncbi:MAG: Txe/YoeB family addiction module toxin [Anditalea sp.]
MLGKELPNTNREKLPYTGSGPPELLKHELSGYWSRRINKEHPIAYVVNENTLVTVISTKDHY